MRSHAIAPCRSTLRRVGWLLLASLWLGAASAQDKVLPGVAVTGSASEPTVEKSYRKMLRGMDLFEREHTLAPQAELRFKLLPRKRDTNMAIAQIEVYSRTVDFTLPVAADGTFALPRHAKAQAEDARVASDRRLRSLTWRVDIRTPGLPANVRRLGDLRLECRVGMESGLVSEGTSLVGAIAKVFDSPDYCRRKEPRYYFFAERPLFNVTLVHGNRRESLPIQRLYAGAIDEPNLARDLPSCDCEVLVERTYELPLGDPGWPDDTRVELEYMDGAE